MADSQLISAFVHGLAAGAITVITLAVARSGLAGNVRVATTLFGVSAAAWLIDESRALFDAMGRPYILDVLANPIGGVFWLFVLAVFADWKVTPLTLAPMAVLLVTGLVQPLLPPVLQDMNWTMRNLISGGLAIHAGGMILRDWSGDLVERRRRFRALLLTLSCLLVVVEVGSAFLQRLDPAGSWSMFQIGHPFGGLMVTLLAGAMSLVILQVQSSAFGATRRADGGADARAEAADRLLIDRLGALMSAEGWRREGLTIGALAAELDTPEHRLRRLINQRLGHRNFADFVNSYRIEAAKRRLADPAEARTTVAAIAFDLGYGSLGPFNRAFRAATGATPTEWRRQALAASPELHEAV